MRRISGLILAFGLLAAQSAMAGNLTFESGQTSWHSTQCVKPAPEASFANVSPETAGDDMNSLVARHNIYVDAAQNYMDCISNEAENDQGLVSKAIASDAQKAIANMQAEVDASSAALHARKN